MRTTLRVAVALITLSAWWVTYAGTREMGLLMSRGVPMSLGMEGWADPASFALFTLMWAVMMIAMMLPSSYPTLLMHRSVYRQRNPSRPGGTLLFASSYFVIWSATGALFYAAYVLVGHWRSTSAISNHVILRAAGVALIVAGLYQWSRLKTSCLKHCQSPLHFMMEHWHDGRGGAIRMGAEHGFYCFGCCWGLMLVLFMMGVMHLGWMAAVSAFILIEKATPTARWIPKLAGGVMVVLGSLVAFVPDTLLALSSQVTLRLT